MMIRPVVEGEVSQSVNRRVNFLVSNDYMRQGHKIGSAFFT